MGLASHSAATPGPKDTGITCSSALVSANPAAPDHPWAPLRNSRSRLVFGSYFL